MRLINIATTGEPFPQADDEDFIESALGENTASLEAQGFRVLETLSDFTVGGQPASGIAYRITDPRGMDLFSILITVTSPDGDGYMMQWASNEANSAEIRAVFQEMIATAQFTD